MDDRRDAGPARLLIQPHLGIATAALATLAILAVRVVNYRVIPLWAPSVGWGWNAIVLIGVALVLASAVYLATRFPVHLRYQVKIEMGTVPLYLMAVLLPPPLAAIAAGVGEAACGWVLQRQRDHHPGDIATQAGRWALIDLAGSLLVHTQHPAPAAPYIGVLVLAAGVLLAGDILTAALQISAINGEPVVRLIPELARGAAGLEAAQYLLGLFGAILAIGNRAEVFLLIVPVTVMYHVAKRAKELREQTREQLERLADKVDGRDPFTHEHSQRVTELTRALMRELNVYGPEAYLVVTAARLHDIGKFSISAAILQKHEQLTPEEWQQMERHPEIGANMLARYPAFARGAAAVRGHHERWDGTGYPDGLAGTDIPFGARVIAVADSFDAMTSDRPYRTGMPVARAAALPAEGKGRQWDPRVVDAFLRLLQAQEEKAPVPAYIQVTTGIAPVV